MKTAIAGALKTASENGVLAVIPKGTPASTFTSIAFVGVECAKTFGKVATGEMSVNEGFGAVQETAGACVAGLVGGTRRALHSVVQSERSSALLERQLAALSGAL